MSYDLHITKAKHWMDSESMPITTDDMQKIADLLEAYKGIPFLIQRGRITICGADERVIGLMIQIAERIGGRVQGDEGEYYDNNSKTYSLPPDYLRENNQSQQQNVPSAAISADGSIHINIPRKAGNKEVDVKRHEVLCQIDGQSNNWKADLAHMGSGKVIWKVTYIGDETSIKSFIFDITSKHNRSKGNARRIPSEGFVYEWSTYLGKMGSLVDETILLKIKWNGREEIIQFP